MSQDSDITNGVTAFYEGYVGAFNRGDMAHYIACFAPPVALVTAQGLRTIGDMQASAAALQARFADLDWSRTEIAGLRIWPLEPALALIVADLDRLRRDGTVFERLRYLYTVRQDGIAWAIVAVTELAAPLPGSDGLLGGTLPAGEAR